MHGTRTKSTQQNRHGLVRTNLKEPIIEKFQSFGAIRLIIGSLISNFPIMFWYVS